MGPLSVQQAVDSPRCVLSVMGDHAGESVDTIFRRKIADIERTGRTFWLVKSRKATPGMVRSLCEHTVAYVLFISPATSGGARPTKGAQQAGEFSEGSGVWQAFPPGLSPVTGKLDSRAYALLFDAMQIASGSALDLWGYADFTDPTSPVRLMLGASTVCAVRKDMQTHPTRAKSRCRAIVAVARLVSPYCVWVR